MRHYKNFTKTTELTSAQQELSESCSIQFIHDDSGSDWYELQPFFNADTVKIQYDSTGRIIAFDNDVSKLFPFGCSVVELEDIDIPDDFQPGSFKYSDGEIIRIPIDYVALATSERDKRMAAITESINQLVEAQDDGDITDAELSELAALREFRTKLRRLDLSTAPDIVWPEIAASKK